MGQTSVLLTTVSLFLMLSVLVTGEEASHKPMNSYSATSMSTSFSGQEASHKPMNSNSATSMSTSFSGQGASHKPMNSNSATSMSTSSSGTHSSDPAAGAHSHSSPSDLMGPYKIVCIYNNKAFQRSGFTPKMINSSMCTYINYEFAILDPKTYEMVVGDEDIDISMNLYEEVVGLKKIDPKLKVFVSLGGWADSTKKYSEMADDPAKRKNFIEKAITFMQCHKFDGLDLSWQYPNCWQGNIGACPKDKDNFATLLEEMRKAFDECKLELSVSVGAIKREIIAAYNVIRVSNAVNHMNMMTYDMHGPWESVTGHHTQFAPIDGDSDPFCNVQSALQFWIDQGADKKKINMGIAFYAKTFTLKDPSNNGMGADAVGIGNAGPCSKNGGLLLYSEICQFVNSGNWTEKEGKNAGFYAFSDDQWACYDPPIMVVRKVKYVCDTGLGGILLKDLGGDDFKGTCFKMHFILAKMARMEIMQCVRKQRKTTG